MRKKKRGKEMGMAQSFNRAARRAVATVLTVAVFGFAGLSGGSLSTMEARAHAGPDSIADLAETLLGSVVNISTAQTVARRDDVPRPEFPPGSPFQEFFDEFFNREGGDSPRRVNSLGSGFVIDPSGIIITNNHVIADADEITVNFSDGSTLEAEVVGRDRETDIAVLRVEPDEPLQAVPFGDSDAMRVGDWVMAIGNPFGFGGTVTVGIVSALNRDIGSGRYDSFIQTDASINRGNSGGPLFNENGEVIGINTAIISPTGGSIGIGFAIPASLATNIVDQLVRFGETRRGWLGVRIQQLTDELAESLGMDEPQGALVAQVIPGGPAEEGGLEDGDVILRFAGRIVPEMRDLPRIVADTPVGDTVDVVVLRRGEEISLEVLVGRLEDAEQAALRTDGGDSGDDTADEKTGALGLTISPLTQALREEYSIGESIEGVVITDVEAGSPSAEKGLAAGEVIIEVAQEPVAGPADLVRRVDELREAGRRYALLLVSNADGERFVAVEIKDE